jgi:aminotransferase
LPDTTGSYYMYWLRIAKDRDGLAKHLHEKGIYTTFRYFPLHLVKHYRSNVRLPNAERMNEVALNIPLHQNITDDEMQHIVSSVKEFFS